MAPGSCTLHAHESTIWKYPCNVKQVLWFHNKMFLRKWPTTFKYPNLDLFLIIKFNWKIRSKKIKILIPQVFEQYCCVHSSQILYLKDGITRQHSTQSVGNMPPPSPPHLLLLPQVLQIMPRNPKYDQFQPKGHHNEENPQSTTKMPGNSKFDPFH